MGRGRRGLGRDKVDKIRASIAGGVRTGIRWSVSRLRADVGARICPPGADELRRARTREVQTVEGCAGEYGEVHVIMSTMS